MNKAGRHSWKLVLIPFSWLYGGVVWIRNLLYDQGVLTSTSFNIPIISVGNITVGGTGKTPHIEYLAGLLGSTHRIATLSRGYKRLTRDFRIVSPESGVREAGDEPLQIKRRFPEITVAVDRRRVHGVRLLMEQRPPLDAILLDDAFQHRSIKPGLSILLMDYSSPNDRDLLLPAGMLREPASNRKRAHIILVTRSPERIKPIELREYVNRMGLSIGQHLYFTTMRYGDLVPVYPGTERREAEWFKKQVGGVLIVSGIARPRPLRTYARSIHTRISELNFPDHHPYTQKDLEKITRTFRDLRKTDQNILVLTTEKDATRFRELDPGPDLREAMHAVRIHVHFLHDDKEAFDRQIWNYVNSNKRSSILYKGKDS